MNTNDKRLVTLIRGDGIGPEIVDATRHIVEAAGAQVAWEEAEAGAEVFKRGDPSGVPPETIASINRSRVVLKGPLETPVGFGEKSANVTLRKLFETYANVRPARELPGVPTRYRGEGVDFLVVRENIEDLYAGIEYMQTPDVAQALKMITRKGSAKVIRYAFELARREGRKKVTCATKANILKLTEGLFKRVFEEIAEEYPDIEAQHLIVDNVAHQFAKDPAQFDVVVMTNMNGDILSDLASGLVGGLGFAGSGNFGEDVAIFEAVHGSAPKYAGKDVANPTAVLLAAIMMLRHIDQMDVADRVENALLRTLEQGKAMTQDVLRLRGEDPAKAASCSAYTEAVIANLGQDPQTVSPRRTAARTTPQSQAPRTPLQRKASSRQLVGVDIFTESAEDPIVLGKTLEALAGTALKLQMISSRGTKVYPPTDLQIDNVDWWRCRFVGANGSVTDRDILDLLERVSQRYTWMHVEKLHVFDGEEGYTRAQGQ